MENPETFTLPTNEKVTFRVYGYDVNQAYYEIEDRLIQNGTNSSNLYFPTNVFEKYQVDQSIYTNDRLYEINGYSNGNNIDKNFVFPNMNHDNSLIDFMVTSSGNY